MCGERLARCPLNVWVPMNGRVKKKVSVGTSFGRDLVTLYGVTTFEERSENWKRV